MSQIWQNLEKKRITDHDFPPIENVGSENNEVHNFIKSISDIKYGPQFY